MDLLKIIEGIRTPVGDAFFTFLANAINEYVLIVIALIILWCVNKTKGYYVMMLTFLGMLCNQFMKIAFRIPRPWVLDPEFNPVAAAKPSATGYSFPSGHTQSMSSLLGGVTMAFKKKWLRVFCIGFIVLTAYSRMYLGVHTLLDVSVAIGISALMVVSLWPAFKSGEVNEKGMYWILGISVAGAIAFATFVTVYPFPADVDVENLAEATKNAWMFLGMSFAVLLTYFVDTKYTKFPIHGVWWAQLLKCAIGTGLVLGVKGLLKAPLNLLFNGHPAADAVRYFFVILMAGVIWPLSFKFWAKVGKKKVSV